jgi:hypothetical protein
MDLEAARGLNAPRMNKLISYLAGCRWWLRISCTVIDRALSKAGGFPECCM